MEISRRADYGVRAMVDVAAAPAGRPVSTAEVARRQAVPVVFLAKIVAQLVRAGLLVSGRGSGGGVTLARPAERISLREIVEALDGPIRLNRCLAGPGTCPRDAFCPMHEIWCQAQSELVARLESSRLSDVVARAQELAARREPDQRGGVA